ncbi:MAG: hypothetical protein ACYCZF_06860 [Anaerolineae bacterium]
MKAQGHKDDEHGADAPTARVGSGRASITGALLEVLKHPLVLLVVGALLSSYLIPSWTNQWQDRQAELEVKITLVNLIDETITQIVMSVQFAVLGSSSQTQAEYDDAYRQWEVGRQIIRSRLQAYYPGSRLLQDWEELSDAVTAFYTRSGTQDPDERQVYLDSWVEMRDRLFQQKDNVNRQILAERIPTFR